MQNRYILLPLLCLTPPAEGFPWDDLRKIFMANVPNAVEILPKFQPPEYGARALETDDRRQTARRQTDGRQHIANVNVSSRSLKCLVVYVANIVMHFFFTML